MAYFDKEFKFVKQENFEDFANAIGLTSERKEKFLSYKPNLKVAKNGDKYTMYFSSSGRSSDLTFTPGVEFDEDFFGRPTKTTFTVDGDTFTQVQNFGEKGTLTIKRIFSEKEVVMELRASVWDGVARRYYSA